MVKRLLKTVVLLSLVFSAFTSFSGISEAASNVNNGEQIVVSGTAQKNLFAHYNNVKSNQLETLKKISNENPNINLKINGKSVDIVTVFPAVQGSVYVNGTPAKVDKNGQFTANAKKGKVNIQLIDSGKVISNETITLQKTTNNINVTNNMNFDTYIDNMDKKNQEMSIIDSIMNKFITTYSFNHMSSMSNMNAMNHTSGMKMDVTSTTNTVSSSTAISPLTVCSSQGVCQPTYPGQTYNGEYVSAGTHVHCNRFNGGNSDHRYWTNTTTQAYIDYVGSDCYIGGGGYNCTSLTGPDYSCDGLNSYGNGVHDCSIVFGYPLTAWYRN